MALYHRKNDNDDDDDDDEFFGNQDDDDNDFGGGGGGSDTYGALADREHLARENELKNVGFLEAYEEHKETRLQEGFQAGYNETFDVAFRIGALLGAATARGANNNRKGDGGDGEGTTTATTNNINTAAAKILRESLIKLEQKSNDETVSETKKDLEDLEEEIKGMLKL